MDKFDRMLLDSLEEQMNTVKFRLLPHYAAPDRQLPRVATAGSVGFDVYATEDVIVRPGERALMPLGFEVQLPKGLEMQLRPRSGRALKEGLTLANAPATIDPDYRGEVGAILLNTNPVVTDAEFDRLLDAVRSLGYGEYADLPVVEPRAIGIKRGERVAQIVFAHYKTPILVDADNLSNTLRGNGGFGSSGLHG